MLDRPLYQPTPAESRERVLDALTEIMKFETDRAFAVLVRQRFLDLTKGSLPA